MTTGLLVDTNIWSEFIKNEPHENVSRWYLETEMPIFLSVITLHEFQYGLDRLQSPVRKRMGCRIIRDVPVLELSKEIAIEAVQLRIEALKRGVTIHLADALIGATALHHDLDVVSRNVRDFAPMNVPIINPFEQT